MTAIYTYSTNGASVAITGDTETTITVAGQTITLTTLEDILSLWSALGKAIRDGVAR